MKLRRYPTSEKLDLYEFKMSTFDDGKSQKFLLFAQRSKMMLNAPGTLSSNVISRYAIT